MAYADIGDIATGAVISETYLDQIRANFQAGVPDIFTAKGDMAAATAGDAAARLAVGADDATLVADSSQATGLAWQIQPAAHVTNSGALLMTQETWTSIAFDTETADTDALHSTSTNTSRLTIPTGGDGWYVIGFSGNASRAAANDAPWQARILLNGTTELAQEKGESGRPAYVNLSIVYPLAATNYIEVQYYSGAVADQSIAIGASFWAIWQRRA